MYLEANHYLLPSNNKDYDILGKDSVPQISYIILVQFQHGVWGYFHRSENGQ